MPALGNIMLLITNVTHGLVESHIASHFHFHHRCVLVLSAIVWSARNALDWVAGFAVMRNRVCHPEHLIWYRSLKELTVISKFTPSLR